MSEEIMIRPMTVEDAEAAAELEALSFADAWDADSLRSTIRGNASFFIQAAVGDRVVGYCGTTIVLDEGEILRVAVHPEYRKSGIGSELLRWLLDNRKDAVQWFLDVREHNAPAIGLYEKMGFRVIGTRKKYYHEPEEDAVLMQRP